MTQQNKTKPHIRQPLMSQQCTICSTLYQISQNQQPNVIQIQNQYYCQNCLQQKLIQQQQAIKHLQQRYIYYKQYQSSFNTKQYCQTQLESNSHKIQDLKQLQKLQQQSLTLDQLLLKAKQQCMMLKNKVLYIQNEQQKFWDSINRFQKRSLKLQQKSVSAKLQLRSLKSQGELLCANSLYHQVFKITIQDNIGYISGLAMGRKPDATQIQWDQFNIGLGHLFLALNIFSMKYDYNFVKFQQLQLKSYLTQVLLYGKDKKCLISYSKQNQKLFGQVMQALLTQVYHFSYHLMQVLNLQYNPDVKLPYPIKQKQYKIADVFINPNKITQKHKWVKWSQGFKYLLIDWKHLMTVHVIYGKD